MEISNQHQVKETKRIYALSRTTLLSLFGASVVNCLATACESLILLATKHQLPPYCSFTWIEFMGDLDICRCPPKYSYKENNRICHQGMQRVLRSKPSTVIIRNNDESTICSDIFGMYIRIGLQKWFEALVAKNLENSLCPPNLGTPDKCGRKKFKIHVRACWIKNGVNWMQKIQTWRKNAFSFEMKSFVGFLIKKINLLISKWFTKYIEFQQKWSHYLEGVSHCLP